jgi:hypothetical protein
MANLYVVPVFNSRDTVVIISDQCIGSPYAADRFCLFPKHLGYQAVLPQFPLRKLEKCLLIFGQFAGGESLLCSCCRVCKKF